MTGIDLSTIKIEPITNDVQFQKAADIIDLLVDADLIEDVQERKKALDILEAITILACDYEKKHYSIPKPDPIEAIKLLVDLIIVSHTLLATILYAHFFVLVNCSSVVQLVSFCEHAKCFWKSFQVKKLSQ